MANEASAVFDFAGNRRFEKQLDFIVEIDKIKNIIRKSQLFDGGRFENDAEHSWTISIMAVLLKEYANFQINIEKVLIMVLIHDIVEVDAGDTFLYAEDRKIAHIEEKKAAQRIFGMLDADQRDFFLETWREFEEGRTNEARFAFVFDRLEPLLQNFLNKGYTWRKNNITRSMVLEKNSKIREGSQEIWSFVEIMLDLAVQRGYLPE
jgi:putative hydrolases of HD superfamily